MSASNGSANGSLASILRPSVTGGYSPKIWVGSRLGQILDGRPRFTWLEAERMRYDPMIQLGLRILRAPLYGVTWKVHADNAPAERWIDSELKQAYRKIMPHALRCFEYGIAAGELTFCLRRIGHKHRVHFKELLEIHPRDARPFIWKKGKRATKLACLEVNNCTRGRVLVDRRHAFWFKGETEFGDWWGRPRLASAYEPWLEKRGRHGAVDARRLWYMKCAFAGPRMRYPAGTTDMGTPGNPYIISNQDVAREIAEKFERGGVIALPGAQDDKGNYLWAWEDPRAFPDMAGMRDYPKDLDKEILQGMGIPPELVEASTVGSGYSGRAIPAQVFFSMMDEIANMVVRAIDEQVVRQVVRWNFGAVGYRIEIDSLAKLVASQGPGGNPAPPMGAGAPGQGGDPMPYQGPRGGMGTLNKLTGRISYTGKKKKPRRLGPLQLGQRAIEKLQRKRRKARCKRIRMSWQQYQGPRGGSGWVSDRGEVRYQTEQPKHESTAGPETVYGRHVTLHPGSVPGFGAGESQRISQGHEDAARGEGITPADLHRRAAHHFEAELYRPGATAGSALDRAYKKARGLTGSAAVTPSPAVNHLLDARRTASPKLQDHIDSALYNVGIEDPDKPPKKYEPDTKLVARRLASAWLDQHEPNAPEGGKAVFEEAMSRHGMKPIGEAGKPVPFSGEYHEGPAGSFTGDKHQIERPGWMLPLEGDREYVVVKAKTVPAKTVPAKTVPAKEPKPKLAMSLRHLADVWASAGAVYVNDPVSLWRQAAGDVLVSVKPLL